MILLFHGVRKQLKRKNKAKQVSKKNKNAVGVSGTFRVLYADPPWSYGDERTGVPSSAAVDHYPTLSIKNICNFKVDDRLIKDICDEDAILFLWTTAPLLEDAFEVINSWGFKYKANFVWDKVKHNMGHYNSVRHEHLLIATRGSCTPDNKKLFDSVVVEEKTKHSSKPFIFYDIIETLYPKSRKLELFHRGETRAGWQCHGFESD